MEVAIIKQPSAFNFSKNKIPFIFMILPYGTTEQANDVRLLVSVKVGQEGQPLKTEYAQNYIPQADGSVHIDVQSILDPMLSFYTPNPNISAVVRTSGQLLTFSIAYELMLNGTSKLTGTTDSYIVLKGGIDNEKINPYRTLPSNGLISLFETINYNIATSDIGFIFWMQSGDSKNYYVNCLAKLEDGTTRSNKLNYQTNNKNSIYCAPIGMPLLVMNGEEKSQIYQYEVGVYDANDTLLSEKKIFDIDDFATDEDPQFLFREAIGGIGSIRMHGDIETTLSVNQDLSQIVRDGNLFANLNRLPDIQRNSLDITEKYKGYTYWLNKKQIELLAQIFYAEDCWMYENKKLVPVLPNSSSITMYKKSDDLTALNIEWQKAISKTAVSEIGTIPGSEDSCPALEIFKVVQKDKNTLSILLSLPSPYDQSEVNMVIGDQSVTWRISGNYGLFDQTIASLSGEATFTARVICSNNDGTESKGPATTQSLKLYTYTAPVAYDDVYTTPKNVSITPVFVIISPMVVAMKPNPMENDYIVDQAEIVEMEDAATTQGGKITIKRNAIYQNKAVIMNYTPPENFVGRDSIEYTIQLVSNTTVQSKAMIFIDVTGEGGNTDIIYVRMDQSFETDQDGRTSSTYTVSFFNDPGLSNPINLTGRGIYIGYTLSFNDYSNSANNYQTEGSALASGSEMELWDGTSAVNNGQDNWQIDIRLAPSNDYTIA